MYTSISVKAFNSMLYKLYMLPLRHCFGGGMVMLWLAGCSASCIRLGMSQLWSFHLHLKQSSLKVLFYKNQLGCLHQVICWEAVYSPYYWNFAVAIYNTQTSFTIIHENIQVMVCMAFHNIMLFPCGCIPCYSKYMTHCLTVHSTLTFIFIQYTDSLARSCVFLILMWLLCNWSNICFCNAECIIIYFPFIMTQLIIARSCLVSQYSSKLSSNSSLFSSHPFYVCL